MGALAVTPDPVNTTASAFDALYRQTAPDVFAYVHSLLRDRAAAEDVTMAAFERAYRARHRFDPRRGSERAWLFAIARNAALDELRRRRRTAPLTAYPAEASIAADEPDPVRRASVRAALGALDPRER